jgi:hypothetical protein
MMDAADIRMPRMKTPHLSGAGSYFLHNPKTQLPLSTPGAIIPS